MTGIELGYHPMFPQRWNVPSWSVNCSRNLRCLQRRKGWKFGYWNYFGACTKAQYARELRIDGWVYAGQNRWLCPECGEKAK